METAAINDSQIVELLAKGDHQGAKMLYDKYASALYGMVHRQVKTHSVAEKILLDTFKGACKDIDSFTKNPYCLFIWLMQLSRANCSMMTSDDEGYKIPENNPILELVINQGMKVQQAATLLNMSVAELAIGLRTELKQRKN